MLNTLYLNGSRYVAADAAPKSNLVRIKHDCERSPYPERNWVSNLIPEPFKLSPEHQIPIKNDPRLLDLLCELNPEYTRERALMLLNEDLCWCNQQWGVFSAPIVTGGAVLEVDHIENGRVYIKYIPYGECPTAAYVLANHLSYLAISVHKDDRRVGYMTRPNGHGDFNTRSRVRMFVVAEQPLWLPESDVQAVIGDVPEDWTGV